MSDKKHIDRLFQERFKDFEATPRDAVWKHIEEKINREQKKRSITPIWWRYAGIAAILALFLTAGGSYFFNKENPNPTTIVDIEDTNTRSSNPSTDTKIVVEGINTIKSDLKNKSEKEINAILNSTEGSSQSATPNPSTHKKANKQPASLLSNKKTNLKNNSSTSNNSTVASISEEKEKTSQNSPSLIKIQEAKEVINNASKDNIAIAKAEDKPKGNLTIEEALASNKEEVIVHEKNANKWRITPNVAPVYFNSLNEGSSIDPQFNSNSKTGEVNMSYGINASYAINEKLKVRSGVNKVNLGYNTNNIVTYQSVGLSSGMGAIQNLKVNTNNGTFESMSIISGENINARPESFKTTNTSINQSFAYIEVPLELQYALINKKLGVNLISGFSSFFLSDNKIYSEAETGSRTLLGEANNINNISYSANFGVGINYQVSKKIDLNLEPMFKYQIKTFDNTSGDFNPYFIGVYTGFTVKF